MMMNSKFECGNQDGDGGENDCNSGHLLRDIEEISKALYLHNTPSKASFSPVHNRSKSAGKSRLSKPQVNLTPGFLREDLLHKDKKSSSAWNWKKPLKALTHIGHQKFNCCFNLHVHSIEGLPLNFDGISLCVHWKKKSSMLQTRPSRVFSGAAEFDETLTYRCFVYGSRTGSSHSAKYESKRFLVYASVVGAPEHDIGNHHVDLTRLLPLTLEELMGDKSSGKWTTSFRLAGKAIGASLSVSFSYQVMKDGLMGCGVNNLNVRDLINLELGRSSTTGNNVVDFRPSNRDMNLQQAGSFPGDLHNGLVRPSHSDDVVLGHEVLLNSGSRLSKSISFLYQKLDEGNSHNSAWANSENLGPLKSQILLESESHQGSSEHESDDEFSIIEQGVETLEGESLKLDQTRIQTVDVSMVEIINVDEIIKDDDVFVDKNSVCDSVDSCKNGAMADDSKQKCSVSCVNLPCMEVADTSPVTSELLGQEHYLSVKSNYKAYKIAKVSHSLDDITESVASDFLNMLAMESGSFRSSCDGDPESPREQLLRQFEKEALASGSFTFDFDANEEESGTGRLGRICEDSTVDSDLSLIIQAAEEEHARVNQSLIYRRKGEILEDLETDSLMQQWGLNEMDFENSLETCSGGFGSPIELPDEESLILPSIGQGLGSFVQTVGGGFLRSMNPFLFKNATNGGNLIVQASNPVVLPAKMGNDILEILLHMASAGVEELCNDIYKLMPLQDITGKSIKHIVWDATTSRGAPGRQDSWQQDLFDEFPYDYLTEGMDVDSVSLEAIAPMILDKIEPLLIEGLRIQSGMSNKEAHSYIHPHHTKMPGFGGRRSKRGFPTLEGVAKLQQEDSGEIGNGADGLMGLSMSLDEWLRLDSGIIEGDQNLEQILKILKVHSKITEFDDEGWKNALQSAKLHARNHGLLGNLLTVAFVVQLRDPLRNYEPVGVPMLVLTQAERVDMHTMQQDHINFLENQEKQMENNALLSETSSKSVDNRNMDNETPRFRFKINEIHLAGVLTNSGKRQLWGTATQQQSGFRWLLASGLGSTVKHSSSKSMAIVRSLPLLTKKLLNEDIFWSISYVHNNMRANAKELAAENVHIRNPDVIFPD